MASRDTSTESIPTFIANGRVRVNSLDAVRIFRFASSCMEPIRYFNRHTGRLETEQVYGEGFLRWTYTHPLGALALATFVKRPFFSAWYGRRMDRPQSARKIGPFISRYRLDLSEFADPPNSFHNFNEFFFRKLKPECRPVDDDSVSAAFPADGRHFGFSNAAEIQSVFVKGQRFDLASLLGDAELARRYEQGTLILSRLCPVDYHRFHFPVAGIPSEPRAIPGPLFSVSPIALRQRLLYLWTNRRVITALDADAFGTVLILEIGATCVGGIHQTFRAGNAVAKGSEKGYFSFGGSSVITLFEPGRIVLADDLLESSARGVELYARFGTPMARLTACNA
jgi:phosphatidylserine decarboxylase